jgi:hypothetical protein
MPGFSISFARLPSWHAIARHAVVAVASFGVGEIERHVRIVAPRGARSSSIGGLAELVFCPADS